MTLAGQWFPVAQQVSLSGDTIELLMQDPLPAPPPGGYYVVEVTGGFVNNTIAGNTIDLTGKSSTGIELDGEDYGTVITGNHFIGGTIYDDGYNGTAISLGATIGSAASGDGAFPLPWGWTALPNLGAIIEDNTIQDSLGGILIGVEHDVNYWAAQVTSASETGRVFVTATVTGNTFEFDAAFLQAWASAVRRRGEQSRRDFHAPDGDHRQRLELRGPRALRQPAVPLDRRRCDLRQRRHPADLRRPDREPRDHPGQCRRGHRGQRYDHRPDRTVRTGLRRDRQRRHRSPHDDPRDL